MTARGGGGGAILGTGSGNRWSGHKLLWITAFLSSLLLGWNSVSVKGVSRLIKNLKKSKIHLLYHDEQKGRRSFAGAHSYQQIENEQVRQMFTLFYTHSVR